MRLLWVLNLRRLYLAFLLVGTNVPGLAAHDGPHVVVLAADNLEGCPGTISTLRAITDPHHAVTWFRNGVDLGGVGEIFPTSTPGVYVAKVHDAISSNSVEIKRFSATAGTEKETYFITEEPRMPVLTAGITSANGPTSGVQGNCQIRFDGIEDCPPPTNSTQPIDVSPGTAPPLIRGGRLICKFEGVVSGCPFTAFAKTAQIHGTNPSSDQFGEVANPIVQRIARKESGCRQFVAPPFGGTGLCPLFGPGGKVGIMQVANPTDDEVWDWRANVGKANKIFEEKITEAREYPNQVRNSDGFRDLVKKFNERRKQQGLPSLKIITLPDFTAGNFDHPQQLERDAIRGYNGWFGKDRFGFQLHEFQIAVDTVADGEVLRVENVDEAALEGDAVWEPVPVEDRPESPGDPNYVENLLALPDCDGGQPPPPPPPDIKVRFLDNENNPIDANLEALNVSNWVTDFGLRNVDFDGELDDPDNIELEPGELDDPDNFRLEVTDPTATGNKVSVGLRVTRPGFVSPLVFYELAEKQGDTFRSQFIRLVSDSVDDSINGEQTVLVELGDSLVLNYLPTQGGIVEEKITVGRPVSENNNGDNQRRHDIRELKVRIFVSSNATFTAPVVTKAKVEQDIARANERLAQATIRLAVLKISMGDDDNGVSVLDFKDGFDKEGPNVTSPDEQALFAHQIDPPDSVVVFYVEKINTPQLGLSYLHQKAIVLDSSTTEQFTLAHELMHILLKCCEGDPSTHRPGEPSTSLLFAPVSGDQTVVTGRKRIGPNPDAKKAGVGNEDTITMRLRVKIFPD